MAMEEKFIDSKTGKSYKKRIRKIKMDDGSTYFKEDIVEDVEDWCDFSPYDSPYDNYDDFQEQDTAVDLIPELPVDMNALPLERQVEILRLHYRTIQDMFNQLIGVVKGLQGNVTSIHDYSQRQMQEMEHRMHYIDGEIYDLYSQQRNHNESWHTLLISPKKEEKDESDIS